MEPKKMRLSTRMQMNTWNPSARKNPLPSSHQTLSNMQDAPTPQMEFYSLQQQYFDQQSGNDYTFSEPISSSDKLQSRSREICSSEYRTQMPVSVRHPIINAVHHTCLQAEKETFTVNLNRDSQVVHSTIPLNNWHLHSMPFANCTSTAPCFPFISDLINANGISEIPPGKHNGVQTTQFQQAGLPPQISPVPLAMSVLGQHNEANSSVSNFPAGPHIPVDSLPSSIKMNHGHQIDENRSRQSTPCGKYVNSILLEHSSSPNPSLNSITQSQSHPKQNLMSPSLNQDNIQSQTTTMSSHHSRTNIAAHSAIQSRAISGQSTKPRFSSDSVAAKYANSILLQLLLTDTSQTTDLDSLVGSQSGNSKSETQQTTHTDTPGGITTGKKWNVQCQKVECPPENVINDLSTVPVVDYTLRDLRDLVKSLEAKSAEKDKSAATDVAQCILDLYYDGDKKNLLKLRELKDMSITLSELCIKEMHETVLQCLETKNKTMLENCCQILLNDATSPSTEFRSSWLNVDGQPADMEHVLAEAILDSNLTSCKEVSPSVSECGMNKSGSLTQTGTDNTADITKTTTDISHSDPEYSVSTTDCRTVFTPEEGSVRKYSSKFFAMQSHESHDEADGVNENGQVECMSDTSERFEETDISDDAESTGDFSEIKLLSSGDARKIFPECFESDQKKDPGHIFQEERRDVSAGCVKNHSDMTTAQSDDSFKFTCPHLHDLDSGSTFFCHSCWNKTPLLDVEAATLLSTKETDDPSARVCPERSSIMNSITSDQKSGGPDVKTDINPGYQIQRASSTPAPNPHLRDSSTTDDLSTEEGELNSKNQRQSGSPQSGEPIKCPTERVCPESSSIITSDQKSGGPDVKKDPNPGYQTQRSSSTPAPKPHHDIICTKGSSVTKPVAEDRPKTTNSDHRKTIDFPSGSKVLTAVVPPFWNSTFKNVKSSKYDTVSNADGVLFTPNCVNKNDDPHKGHRNPSRGNGKFRYRRKEHGNLPIKKRPLDHLLPKTKLDTPYHPKNPNGTPKDKNKKMRAIVKPKGHNEQGSTKVRLELYGSKRQNSSCHHQNVSPVYLSVSPSINTGKSYTNELSAKQKVYNQWSATFVRPQKRCISYSKVQRHMENQLKIKIRTLKVALEDSIRAIQEKQAIKCKNWKERRQ